MPTSGIIETEARKGRCPFIQHANERAGREVGREYGAFGLEAFLEPKSLLGVHSA